jgi:hypothetical protein
MTAQAMRSRFAAPPHHTAPPRGALSTLGDYQHPTSVVLSLQLCLTFIEVVRICWCVLESLRLHRLSVVMDSQSKALIWMRRLVLGLTIFLLMFSVSAFVLLDVYLLSSVSEARLRSLDRTRGYVTNSIMTCLALRNMHLSCNVTDPAVFREFAENQKSIKRFSIGMHDIHMLNFVSPPSQGVADFFLRQGLSLRVADPGSGLYSDTTTNFWDLFNQFISSSLMASKISPAQMCDEDFTFHGLDQSKRAVVFLWVTPASPLVLMKVKIALELSCI